MRESQAHISAGQESGIIAQAETNRLLGVVVSSLEQANNLIDRSSEGSSPHRMTSRLAEICDDLTRAVTGLVTAQDTLASNRTSNMEQLDRLIKSATNLLKEDLISTNNRKRMSISEGGPGGKKRSTCGPSRNLHRDGGEESGALISSPMSKGGVVDGGEGLMKLIGNHL